MSGVPSVKNFYRDIITTKDLRKFGGWRRFIWHWNMQLKIKLFLWLTVTGKILTWDIL